VCSIGELLIGSERIEREKKTKAPRGATEVGTKPKNKTNHRNKKSKLARNRWKHSRKRVKEDGVDPKITGPKKSPRQKKTRYGKGRRRAFDKYPDNGKKKKKKTKREHKAKAS